MKDVTAFFPAPQQVAATDVDTLRTAGLSTRKAEYGRLCFALNMDKIFIQIIFYPFIKSKT
jgi:hypothetical protein